MFKKIIIGTIFCTSLVNATDDVSINDLKEVVYGLLTDNKKISKIVENNNVRTQTNENLLRELSFLKAYKTPDVVLNYLNKNKTIKE